MTVFLGTLCGSIKQIKAPYVFDWEHRIALHAMQGNRDSCCNEGEVSRLVDLQEEPDVYSRVTAGMAIKNSFLFIDVRTPV